MSSLLADAMESCTMLNKVTIEDGYGGYIDTYYKGVQFKAAITFDSSIMARRADNEGVKSLYTVTTTKALMLEFNDVFQRDRDGKIFKVTSDGDDKFTPNSTDLDMRQVTAKEWELPRHEQSTSNP